MSKITKEFLDKLKNEKYELVSLDTWEFTQEIIDLFPEVKYPENCSFVLKTLILKFTVLGKTNSTAYEMFSPVTVNVPFVKETRSSGVFNESRIETRDWIYFFNDNFSSEYLKENVIPYLIGLNEWVFSFHRNIAAILRLIEYSTKHHFATLLLEEILKNIEVLDFNERNRQLRVLGEVLIDFHIDKITKEIISRFPELKLSLLNI